MDRRRRGLLTSPRISRTPCVSGPPTVKPPEISLGRSRSGCFAHLYSMQRVGRSPTGQSPAEYVLRFPFAQTVSSGMSAGSAISAETSSLNHAAAISPPLSFCGENERTVRPSTDFHENATVTSSPSNEPSGMLRTSTSIGSPAISSLR